MRTVRANPRASRLRTLFLVALGVLFILFLSASGIAQLYTDWLWFSNLDLGSVWTTILGTRVVLAAVFTLTFFAILWLNLYLADRLAPEFRPASPEEDLIERYHQLVGAHVGKIRIAVSAVFAFVAGANTSSQWQTWILFNNGGDFGRTDPLFDRDASFYVFRLPFWTFLVDWFFAAMVFALIVSIIAHYLNGGIRASGGATNRVTSSVKLHLSILLAILALLRAVAYYFDRFELVNAGRGFYDGALATDVEIQLPALNLLALISIAGAGLFIANIWRKGWGLPMVAVGLWAASHVIVGGIFPALYQRLRVEPEESVREAQYIGDNIDATRFAYGLGEDRLTTPEYSYSSELTSGDIEQAADIIDDISIVDRQLTAETFARNQAERESYAFADVLDVDRYRVDGDLSPVVLAVRGLNVDGVEEGFERRNIAFTHGWGLAMAEANDVTSSGQPEYLVEGIGPSLVVAEGLDEPLDTPQVYFAEDLDGYAVVGASRAEVDYVASGEVPFRYDGDGGVPIGSPLRRLAFALRFQDLDPLISAFVQSESEVIYNRDIEDRVRQLAPFLEFDSDPYPVLTDGQLYWIIDGYTTTNDFPYSQKMRNQPLGVGGGDLQSGFNYVRNSVKAVVDAYNGDVSFYIVDEDDPIINAYASAFPDLFSPVSEVPDVIRDHFRYPVDIFKVQTDVWSRYQIQNPTQFLEGALSWKIAAQPSADGGDSDNGAEPPMEPQYRTTRLPGETEQEFVLQRAFVPASSDQATGRPELTAVLVARSDGDQYGQLVQYELQTGQVNAPDLIDADIRKESDISAFISLREGQGSRVRFGEMQMVLIEDAILYIRPLYIQASASNAVPELDQVIAVNGTRIAMEETLDEAISQVLVDAPPGDDSPPIVLPDPDPGDTTEPSEPPPVTDLDGRSVAELTSLVQEYLDAADLAEEQGNADTAADFRADARAALEALERVLGIDSTAPNESGEV